MSWDNVTIPSGSTVSSATVEVFMKYASFAGTRDIVTRMQGFNVDDVAVFSSTNRPSQIPQTTASVDRTYIYSTEFVDETYLSLDDCTAIIQEIIDRGGWASGQALGVVFKDNGSAANQRWQFQDYGRSTGDAAKITIVYTAGAGGTNIAATTDSLVLTEYSATVNAETNVNVGTDALTLTEYPATVSLGIDVQVGTDALTLTEYPATVNAETNVLASTDVLVLTEYPVTVSLVSGTNVLASTDTLVLTEYPATVNAEVNIVATTDALTLTTYPVTIGLDVGVTIDGAQTYVIAANHGSVTMYNNGTNYFTV